MKEYSILLFFVVSFISAQEFPALLPKPQILRTADEISYSKTNPEIVTQIVKNIPQVELNSNEAYRLHIMANNIQIDYTDEKGLYWAKQTLNQLALFKEEGVVYYPLCEIIDWPAFRIRGFMQDVGRTFIPLGELKREIELLSQFKINVFHWHLTEDIAWRLESKRYPQLTKAEHMIRNKGEFYTQSEARELVEFCKEHNILLIPEIDMPGHSEAFKRALGYDMQSPEGMVILKDLIDEICDLFDVPYLHIGTDEVEFTNPDFVPEMVNYIRRKGKKVISWNPGWHYNPGEIDMTQLWSYRGKAQKGIPAVDSRFHYLNHFDTFGDMVALYNSRIAEHEKGSDDIAGGIIAIWHDRNVEGAKNILNENNFYPNALAFAERAWRGGGTEYFDKNGTILKENTQAFEDFVDFESRVLHFKKQTFANEPFTYVRQTDVKWRITEPFPNDGDLSRKFPPEEKLQTKYHYKGKTYATQEAVGAGIYLRHVWGKLVPSFYDNPQENHTAYAYTYVYSLKKQTVGLWAEFQNYSRSEKDLPPPQGKWDYKESAIFINGKAIYPPLWTATHTEKSNEIPLGNENFVSRPPIPVTLKKGWNKVLVKLPVGKFSTREVRLVKWMFTAVFVNLDGEDRPEGLIYSPTREK